MDGGENIGGYRLATLLQSGQASQVYEVVEEKSKRHFAMKILLPEAAKDADQRAMLFHEADIGIKLTHPNVIKIQSVNKDPATPFFVMEFFPSGSLKKRLMQKEQQFLKDNMEKIVKQAATGLAYMNASGYVHRDIKPDNILVNASGDLRLIDFAISYKPPSGLAKLFHRKGGKAQGTRSYMSPEQIRGEILDARADIYSFGATVYELMTGRPPFRGNSNQDLLTKHILEKPQPPKQLCSEMSDDFNDLLMRTLEKKRDDRPRDFHEVLMKLRNIRVYKPVLKQKRTD